jgi:hypothetical protein
MCAGVRLLIATIFTVAAAVSAADPLIGTWKLNVSRSKFNPGPAPRSQTRTYEESPAGVKVTVRTTDARGASTTVEFPAIYDGKTYPVTGPGPADALALEKINNFQARATLKHAGMVVATAERTLSDNGTILTIHYQEPGGERPIDNVSVYEKQVTTIER